MRVLVADDDPLVRHAVCAMLRALGHSVLAAEDGLQAWEIIQAEDVALLITDWQMPGLDGPALLQRVRDAGLPHYVFCILLTVRDQRTDRIAGLDAGEEFLLLLPGTTLEAAGTIAERVRAQIAMTPLVLPDRQALTLQASIGVTSSANGAVTLEALVASTDQALYAAKHAGRNRVYCAEFVAAPGSTRTIP